MTAKDSLCLQVVFLKREQSAEGVLSLSCCDLQAPLGQGRPCNLWTPLHIPVGAQGQSQRGARQGPARGARPGSEDIPAPACCATFANTSFTGLKDTGWARQGKQTRGSVCGNARQRQARSAQSWAPCLNAAGILSSTDRLHRVLSRRDACFLQQQVLSTSSPEKGALWAWGPRQPLGFPWAGSTELVHLGRSPFLRPLAGDQAGPGTAAPPWRPSLSVCSRLRLQGPFPSPPSTVYNPHLAGSSHMAPTLTILHWGLQPRAPF